MTPQQRLARAVSVSNELAVLQRAVEGASLLVEVARHGGVEGEESAPQVAAILALVSCRLRDLGRAARGTLDAERFWAPHNAVVEPTDSDQEDLVLYPAAPPAKPRR